MPVTTLLKTPPPWADSGDAADWAVVACHCTLARNFSDFVFPARCNEGELCAVASRVRTAVEGALAGLTAAPPASDAVETAAFAERWLVTDAWPALPERGRTLHLSPAQDLAVSANTGDHLLLRAALPGNRLEDAWARASQADDALSALLNYACDDRLGFLTARLDMTGTGLRAGALLHLPALAARDALGGLARDLAAHRLALLPAAPGNPPEHGGALRAGGGHLCLTAAEIEPLPAQCLLSTEDGARTAAAPAAGDLYVLHNTDALGVPEEELVLRVGHAARQAAGLEEQARNVLARDRERLEDRIARAVALARGARLLGFREGLVLLSTLRLGRALDLVSGPAPGRMARALAETQAAHLCLMRGAERTALSVAAARARYFQELLTE